MNTSILSSLKKDFYVFFFPSLLTALICLVSIRHPFAVSDTFANLIFFVIFYAIDSGHTFVTGIRVFRKWNSESLLYLVLALNIFLLSLVLASWKPLWLFRFYLYLTFYHHV